MATKPPDFAALVAKGLSDPEIARRIGVTARTVLRWRAAEGLASRWSKPSRGTRHGTYTAYTHYGCRCDKCKEANAERARRGRSARIQKTCSDGPPQGVQHGLSAAQNWKCRCDVCTTALRIHNKDLNKKHGEHSHRVQQMRNEDSIRAASRHRYEWTGAELDVAARTDLTDREVAKMLGRSNYAVRAQRRLLNAGDPRTVLHLGESNLEG